VHHCRFSEKSRFPQSQIQLPCLLQVRSCSDFSVLCWSILFIEPVVFRMSEIQDSVDMDKLGQAAYTGQLAVVVDALKSNKQLAHVADTVSTSLYYKPSSHRTRLMIEPC